mmetsp:Transcript_65106/g.204032  ORF Transcript_65106/g.204032 Transcript_65106/m.204032 type:complete len:216 (-) Transcript_65106:45-692(-)
MYANHAKLTRYGFQRGLPGFFDRERSPHVPEHIDKESICSVPLSRPSFSLCVLLVWTLTVAIDLRKILFYAELLLVRQETTSSIQGMLKHRQDRTVLLKGLTRHFKAMLLLVIFVPRLAIDIALLWLGCRWLAATASFSDLLLNTVALEFIMLLKDVVYNAVVPKQKPVGARHNACATQTQDASELVHIPRGVCLGDCCDRVGLAVRLPPPRRPA